MVWKLSFAAAALVVLALAASPVVAQESQAVTGRGTVEVQKQPDVLSLQADVRTKGKTLAEALGKMKQRQDAARQALLNLGAPKESIRFGDVLPLVSPPAHLSHLPAPIQPGAELEPAQPPVVVVIASLQARWSLKGLDQAQVLLLAEDLRKKVRADVLGLKEHKPLPVPPPTGEPAAPVLKPCNCGCESAEPVFLYVGQLTEQEQAKALGQAFAKARQAARLLAAAAGTELGPLQTLTGGSALAAQGPPGLGVAQDRPAAEAEGLDGEVIALQPGPIAVRLSVAATFRLQPAGRSGK
jgi:uncharacterized protein YggE